MTGRVSSRHPAVSILGVTLTPCAEGPCETGCLALLPDISFFWKRCGPCPPVLESTYLSKSAPPSAGNSQRRRGGAGASIAQMYICTACRGYPGPLCRLRAEKFAAIHRRKEKNVDENKKEHHLHIVLTTQQYQLLCYQAKECRLTKRHILHGLLRDNRSKPDLQKKLKSSGRKYIISATTSTRSPAASMPELRSRRMPNGGSIFWIRYMSLCSG